MVTSLLKPIQERLNTDRMQFSPTHRQIELKQRLQGEINYKMAAPALAFH